MQQSKPTAANSGTLPPLNLQPHAKPIMPHPEIGSAMSNSANENLDSWNPVKDIGNIRALPFSMDAGIS